LIDFFLGTLLINFLTSIFLHDIDLLLELCDIGLALSLKICKFLRQLRGQAFDFIAQRSKLFRVTDSRLSRLVFQHDLHLLVIDRNLLDHLLRRLHEVNFDLSLRLLELLTDLFLELIQTSFLDFALLL